MNLEIALGLLVSCAVALIFMQRSLGLFRRHVWIRTDGRIVDASVGRETGGMSIEVRYEAAPNPSGPQAEATVYGEITKSFDRHESIMDKFASADERIDAVVGRTVDVWYAQAKPAESYLKEPSYFLRILKGIAGLAFGAALLGFTVYLAKFGPDGVMEFMSWN